MVILWAVLCAGRPAESLCRSSCVRWMHPSVNIGSGSRSHAKPNPLNACKTEPAEHMQNLNLRPPPARNEVSLPCVIALLVNSQRPASMNPMSTVAVRRGCLASPWKLAVVASRALCHPANALPAPCACSSTRDAPDPVNAPSIIVARRRRYASLLQLAVVASRKELVVTWPVLVPPNRLASRSLPSRQSQQIIPPDPSK